MKLKIIKPRIEGKSVVMGLTGFVDPNKEYIVANDDDGTITITPAEGVTMIYGHDKGSIGKKILES